MPMNPMANHPEISYGSVIKVGSITCIVRSLCNPMPPEFDSVCIVVFDEGKPTSCEVSWNGSSWYFPERGDFGGYVDKSDPLLNRLKLEKSRSPF